VDFSPDGRRLATAEYYAAAAKLWDVPSRRLIANLSGHNAAVWCLAFSPMGSFLATGSHDTSVGIWLADQGKHVTWLSNGFPVYGLAFHPSGELLAVAGNGIRLWDVASWREAQPLKGDARAVRAVAFSPDGVMLATATWRDVRLWDCLKRTELAHFPALGSYIRSLAFASNGRYLVSGTDEGTIAVCDVFSRQVVARLAAHIAPIYTVAFAPDGKSMASASWDGTVKLWQAANWQTALTLREHTGPVAAVAFSAQGDLMATCGSDCTARLWEAASLAEATVTESPKPRR
jgi:WD40 repeat protein